MKKLGTFLGVFLPTILTILGVIMYLRFGWLLGHLGLARIVLIVILANTITAVTSLSFSAVATNTHVGVGGAYFIISRSLGIEIGGAIGLPLFLSQVLSITLYSFGLAESLRIVWPAIPVQAATIVIILAVCTIALLGARYALKTQVPLMIFVAVSLAALAAGAVSRYHGQSLTAFGPSGEIDFWHGFAVFFPAVTGIMAGLGLSGDLSDPGRSIPKGTLAAVFTGFAVYLAVPVLLAMGADADALRGDSMVWTRIALFGPWCVFPGLWAAIFSSAVGSALAAPRTLLALSRDGLAPGFLGRKAGGRAELVPGLAVTLAIALGAVLLGNLNAVAVVVSIFFLTVYGTGNVVAAFEALSGDPSWRPKIRVPWPVNLAGGAACAVVMFLISPVAGAIAVAAEAALWLWLSRREFQTNWGDARRGLYENMIRWALIHLARRPMSARNWRPHILVFAEGPFRELELVRYANWFSHGRGIVTVCGLAVADLLKEEPDLQGMRKTLQDVFDAENLTVFAEVHAVRDLVDGIIDVAQANGMAGIASNTVMLGWPRESALRTEFLKVMQRLNRLNVSLVIGRVQDGGFRNERRRREIHIWWGGLQQNGDLMLLLAFLLTRNTEWRRARVKVMSLASTETAMIATRSYLEKLIPEIRIKARPHVILKPRDATVAELIQKESRDADVVFMGLATPEEGEEETYAERLAALAGDLPNVFFVKNASLFIGELLEVDGDANNGAPEPRS